MEKLSKDWFFEGLLDFEYKKYVLLAYLQHVSREFAEVKLYPAFSDLIFHYNNLKAFRSQKQQLSSRFPTRMSEEEFAQMRLAFEPEIEDDGEIKEVEAIVDYSLPAIERHLKEGKEIYEYIDQQLSIEPVGVTPLYNREGYLLLRMERRQEIDAYEYRIVFFENVEANYHGISLEYLTSFRQSLVNTYESIKLNLVRTHGKYPNPATYVLYSGHLFPRESTLIPVAKRKFLTYMR